MYRYEEGRAPIQARGIGDILAQLAFVRGLGKTETRSKLVQQWKETISVFFPPEIVQFTNPGNIRNGKLTVYVNGVSAILQELTFRKKELLTQWNKLYPEEQLRSLIFKQGK